MAVAEGFFKIIKKMKKIYIHPKIAVNYPIFFYLLHRCYLSISLSCGMIGREGHILFSDNLSDRETKR